MPPGEAGHATLALRSDDELRLFQYVSRKHDGAGVEHFLSGRGFEPADIPSPRTMWSVYNKKEMATFERCHEVPRDQFVLPWALGKERVPYVFFTEKELAERTKKKVRQELIQNRRLWRIRNGEA